ncbi:MAG TPA: 2,3-bisphosphoglycerate-independent phosphoglycerate mutase [Longimicrobiales bacterium]|jgi:2,3-bisphosphoglycerate-independent phosphoglycerate mutase
MKVVLPDDLVERGDSKIVFLIMDGLGGLPHPETGLTELETAQTPNLDRLAQRSALGLIEPVLPGITPGSGPGHLALFGYDPVRWNIGRGVLSALGVGFDLRPGDVAARLNFATVDAEGRVTDRRAGRPSDEENRRLVAKLRERVKAPPGVELFFESEKEHRAVMVLRGEGLSAELADTDPQATGVPPLHVRPLAEAGEEGDVERTARLVQGILDDAREALRDEPKANAVLARGFAAYERYPSMADRYKLRSLAIARYPMYRGLARLVGMDTLPIPATDEASVDALAEHFGEYDFYFVHFKATDSTGEDGNFEAKVKAIEAVDRLVERVVELKPDVLVVTGDHSTPSALRSHSWHPVPVLIASRWARPQPGVTGFGERECRKGELGVFPAVHLMTLALAHAGRLAKFGA